MAAGKSTLTRELADREHAVLLVQDDLLDTLFPGEITDIQGFVKCSSRLCGCQGRRLSRVGGPLSDATGLRTQCIVLTSSSSYAGRRRQRARL